MSALAIAGAGDSALAVDLDCHAPALDAILAGLAAPLAQIDESFVSVGDELVTCATMLAEVTARFEELPGHLESAEIVEGTGRLEDVIRHAREIVAGFGAEQRALDALVARVDAAHAPMAALRKTIQMIGIVSINARVVAAGIAGEADELEVFTTDIAGLSTAAAGTIQRFFRAYESLSADLHKAAAERLRFQASQQSALADVASRLSARLAELTERRRRSAESSVETGRIMRDIGARVGRTVMAMQVGDATRQRIEHAVKALNDIRSLVFGRVPPAIDFIDPPGPQDLSAGLDLVGTQLDAALDDFDRGIVEAEQSMLALAADGEMLMDHSRALYEHKDHQGESALGELSAGMHEVSTMLSACDADRHKLDAAARAVGRKVGELLGHVEAVQQIEGSMRLVTLNAAVKCAQLGPRGKALDVIAMQLRELTGDTVTSAKTALAVLNDAAERAEVVTGSADGEAADGIARLLDDATAALALFETADQRQSAALKLLHSRESGCNRKIGDAVEHFSGHASISETLAEMCVRIVGVSGEIAAAGTGLPAGGDAGGRLLGRFRSYYSMQSERRIHDQFVGADPDGVAAEGPPAQAVEDDLGLF